MEHRKGSSELNDLPKAIQQVSGRDKNRLLSAQDCIHWARIIPGKAATVRPQTQIITHLVLFVPALGDEMQMVQADAQFQILCVSRLQYRSRLSLPLQRCASEAAQGHGKGYSVGSRAQGNLNWQKFLSQADSLNRSVKNV